MRGDEVERAVTWWTDHGRPSVDRFGLTVAQDGSARPWFEPYQEWFAVPPPPPAPSTLCNASIWTAHDGGWREHASLFDHFVGAG